MTRQSLCWIHWSIHPYHKACQHPKHFHSTSASLKAGCHASWSQMSTQNGLAVQAQQVTEEAGRLSREKAALLATVQSLKADNDRLRAFKRKLLHSLQNDSEASLFSVCPACWMSGLTDTFGTGTICPFCGLPESPMLLTIEAVPGSPVHVICTAAEDAEASLFALSVLLAACLA